MKTNYQLLVVSVFWLTPMLLTLAGCGGDQRVIVKGRVHNNNKPLKIQEMTGGLRVEFFLLGKDASKDPQEAIVEPDGSFRVPGNDGNGIPPGKVKIVVEWRDDHPLGPDRLKGMYSEQNSKIIREITPDGGDININVGNPPTAE